MVMVSVSSLLLSWGVSLVMATMNFRVSGAYTTQTRLLHQSYIAKAKTLPISRSPSVFSLLLSTQPQIFAVSPEAARSASSKPMPKNHMEGDDEWLPSVILKRNAQSKSFRNGNQLIFSKSIHRFQMQSSSKAKNDRREPSLGQLVQVKVEAEDNKTSSDNGNRMRKPPILLGWGVYNPKSLYRVRMLCHRFLLSNNQYHSLLVAIQQDSRNSESEALSHILRHQLNKAWQTRQAMQFATTSIAESGAGKPFYTDTFRLLNGEGDQLSGLAVDVIGGQTAVVMSSAAWCQVHKSTILATLKAVFARDKPEMEWIWKTTETRLDQDGYKLSVDKNEEQDETKQDKMVLCMENGIKFATWPHRRDVQKTSVYCDQRENRLHLAQMYCKDKRVLDLCCYHGGFSLNAILNGDCRHATGVDSSADAIDACWHNAKLNNVSDEQVSFIRSDITKYLQDSFETQEESFFDVVVLDPPKLAPSANALDKARRKYHALNRDAIKVVDPSKGGLLLTCTCSAAMTQKDGGQYFLNMVQGAAQAAGREITLLRVSGAAPCHTQSPISWPAGNYLTASLFRVHPSKSAD